MAKPRFYRYSLLKKCFSVWGDFLCQVGVLLNPCFMKKTMILIQIINFLPKVAHGWLGKKFSSHEGYSLSKVCIVKLRFPYIFPDEKVFQSEVIFFVRWEPFLNPCFYEKTWFWWNFNFPIEAHLWLEKKLLPRWGLELSVRYLWWDL